MVTTLDSCVQTSMEKLFSCEICEKEFSNILKQHSLGHSCESDQKVVINSAGSLSITDIERNCEDTSLQSHVQEQPKPQIQDTNNSPISCSQVDTSNNEDNLENYGHHQQLEYKSNDVFNTNNSNNTDHLDSPTYQQSLQLEEGDVRTGDALGTDNKIELESPPPQEQQQQECCTVTYSSEADTNESNACSDSIRLETHLVQQQLQEDYSNESSSAGTQQTSDYTTNKPYICTLCHKSFSRSYHLKMHSLTHSGLKPFACYTCSKSFSRSSDLKRHLATHTGVKPFGCTLCHKYFSRSSDLRRHTATHSGERPHSCEICQKAFTRSSDLHRHSQTHTGIKPHACHTCGKAFSTATHLKRHTTTHTVEQKAFNVTFVGNLSPRCIT